MFLAAVAGLGLSREHVDDGVTMASELAANTLHAHRNVEFDSATQWAVAGAPEFWLYLRHTAGRTELACKVFDSLRGWKRGAAPKATGPGPDAVSGRGLQVVAGLSEGRWGHHLSRARFGSWKVPGKAVWFALPVTAPDGVSWPPCRPEVAPAHAARRLHALLTARGVESIVRADAPAFRMSVLSVRQGLTVWCRGGSVRWQSPAGGYERRGAHDLEEASERIVCVCEELDSASDATGGRWRAP